MDSMDSNGADINRERLVRELRITRICCVVTSLLTVCLLVGGVLIFGRLQPVFEFMEEAKPVMAQIEELDVEEFNTTLKQVNTTLDNVDWNQVTDSLGQLNVEAVNNAIEGLDVEEFSKAIENLNKAAATIESLGERLNSFTALFGR